jgi:hypothetical protein
MQRTEIERVRVTPGAGEDMQTILDERGDGGWVFVNAVATEAYIYLFFMELDGF